MKRLATLLVLLAGMGLFVTGTVGCNGDTDTGTVDTPDDTGGEPVDE